MNSITFLDIETDVGSGPFPDLGRMMKVKDIKEVKVLLLQHRFKFGGEILKIRQHFRMVSYGSSGFLLTV